MSILHFSGLNELHSVSKAVKGHQTWMLKTGPSADKLEEYHGEGDAVKGYQIVMPFGRQPQWVVVNFAKNVIDLTTGEYEVVPSTGDPIEEGTVTVAGLIDGAIGYEFRGSLTFTKGAGRDFDVWFECKSKRPGYDWVFKVGEFKYRDKE